MQHHLLWIDDRNLDALRQNPATVLRIFEPVGLHDLPERDAVIPLHREGAEITRLVVGPQTAWSATESQRQAVSPDDACIRYANAGSQTAYSYRVFREVAVWQQGNNATPGSQALSAIFEDDCRSLDIAEKAFFVTAVDGARVAKLLGPFDDHLHALLRVSDVRTYAMAQQPWAAFWQFGTASMAHADATTTQCPLNAAMGVSDSERSARSGIATLLRPPDISAGGIVTDGVKVQSRGLRM